MHLDRRLKRKGQRVSAERNSVPAMPALNRNCCCVLLRAAAQLPRIGFGCAGGIGRTEVAAALAAGYRLLDTAQSAM